MTIKNIIFQLSAALVLVSVSTSGNAFAGEIERTQSIAAVQPDSDVALKNGGVLAGQIVNEQGLAMGNSKVVLLQQGKLLAVTQADRDGRFTFSGLKPGVYQVDTSYGARVCRVWAPGTAPPVAKNGVTIVTSGEVVRGQDVQERYGPAIRGAVAGGLLTGFTYWALDYNANGS